MLSDLGGMNRANDRFIEDVLFRRPLGVIMVQSTMDAAQIEQLKSRSIPTVVVDTDGEPPSGTPTVGSSNWNGRFAHGLDLLQRETRPTATNMIFDLAQGRAPINGNVELGTTLVVRQSTAPPPRA